MTRIAVKPCCNSVVLAVVVGSTADDLYSIDEFESVRQEGYEIREIASEDFRTGPYRLKRCECTGKS